MAGAARGQCESQLAKVVGAPGSAGANTGVSVSIDGDTMAVGSPYSDINGTDAGAVFVYRRVNGAWTQEALLTYGSPGWWLGWSVSLSGDTLVAGAPGAPRGNFSSGGVFEFRRTAGNWALQSGYATGDDSAGGYTGTSCAVMGDIMIYGSMNLSNQNGGTAYVFTRENTAGSFGFRRTLSYGPIVATDGQQVACALPNASALYTMRRPPNDAWGPAAYETIALGSEPLVGANSIAIRNNTLVVGSPGYDGGSGRVNQGAVYVFERIGQSLLWNRTLRITDPDNTDQDFFGWSIAFDTQNPDRFAVGSVWANVGGAADAGAAFVFERDGLSEWRQIRREVALDADEGDQLGMCVAMSGGFLAAGAPTDDQQAGNGGAAYVFSVDPQRPIVGGGPNASTVRVGQNALFSVTAAGGGPITYQWRRDGQALADGGRIAGSRTPTLRLRSCRWADVGIYDCLVSNGCGATASDGAALTVLCPADFNDDAFLDFFDYDDFIHAFETGGPGADFNADGFVDFFDYDDFVAAFEAGC